MLDLNTLITPNSGASLTDATSINDAGQIVASASQSLCGASGPQRFNLRSIPTATKSSP